MENKKWTDEQKDILLEIYQREGHFDLMHTFGNDEEKMKAFFKETGMDGYARHYSASVQAAVNAMTEENRLKAIQDYQNAARVLYETVKLRLYEGGIDTEKNYGKDLTPEEKVRMVRERLMEFGIPMTEAEKVNEDNVDEYINEDKDFEFELDDTPAARNFCKKEGIDFDSRGGKLYMQGSLHLQKCLALPDTDEVRSMLDKEGIQYIDTQYAKLAQGKRGKFLQDHPVKLLAIPLAWTANGALGLANRTVNSQYRNRIFSYGLLAASLALPIQPHVIFVAWLLMRKLGMFKKNREGTKVTRNLYELLANRKGNTVFKEFNRQGRKEGVYLTQVNGNLVRIPARDVRIPSNIMGINLNQVQREQFRKGKLVTLTNAKGQEFGVRIDLTNPKMYAVYGKAMRSDKTMTAVPDPKSPTADKLEYISRKGFQGVRDIYGESRINLDRDTFLDKHGLKQNFWMGQNAEERLKIASNETQIKQATEEWKKADSLLKDSAYNLVISQHQGRKL